MDPTSRIYAEINLTNIAHNISLLGNKLPEGCSLMPVIKANGYGHGAVELAGFLEHDPKVERFAVATTAEALELRKAGIRLPILILGYTAPEDALELAEAEITVTVFKEDMLLPLCQAAEETGKAVKVHVKVDTGMSRIGISSNEAGLSFIERVYASKGLVLEGMFTHFARADETDRQTAYDQLAEFKAFVHLAEKRLGITIPVKHCANSAAVLAMPESYMDMVRPGIAMYGLWPSEEMKSLQIDLRPALSLYSRIVYIKDIAAETSVSYGGTFTAKQAMRIATIPVGYADGYPRSLSGKGYVLLHGHKAPILGRICMDQFMIDVTHIPEAKEGDLVVLIGASESEQITMEEMGALSGRFNYEFACDLGRRVYRTYRA